MNSHALLDVRQLTVKFRGEGGWLTAVNDVSFSVAGGECVGIVGESGSGKSVTALSLLRLHESRSTSISGIIRFDGRSLLELTTSEMRAIRGARIAMIFQDPMSCLNPVLTIGSQIIETLKLHRHEGDARRRAIELLEQVRIPNAAGRLDDYPHQLSGGMRQRVMIAMAIACRPRLLIADEPTTALDVTIQAQVLQLLSDLQRELGMAMLLITHDLGVIAEFAHRVIVMYAGSIVETAPVEGLFGQPYHPYTEGLLRAVPDIDVDRSRLATIPGSVPDAAALIQGCRFGERCKEAQPSCFEHQPNLSAVGPLRTVRCPPRLGGLGGWEFS